MNWKQHNHYKNKKEIIMELAFETGNPLEVDAEILEAFAAISKIGSGGELANIFQILSEKIPSLGDAHNILNMFYKVVSNQILNTNTTVEAYPGGFDPEMWEEDTMNVSTIYDILFGIENEDLMVRSKGSPCVSPFESIIDNETAIDIETFISNEITIDTEINEKNTEDKQFYVLTEDEIDVFLAPTPTSSPIPIVEEPQPKKRKHPETEYQKFLRFKADDLQEQASMNGEELGRSQAKKMAKNEWKGITNKEVKRTVKIKKVNKKRGPTPYQKFLTDYSAILCKKNTDMSIREGRSQAKCCWNEDTKYDKKTQAEEKAVFLLQTI